MSTPNNVVFVRHGQSEANVLQEAEKEVRTHELAAELRERPDWQHRLTERGIEQAKATGAWLIENVGPLEQAFDARYVSAFLRARETAAYLGGTALTWRPHSLLHERDWGEFGEVPRSDRAELYPRTTRMRKTAPLYARYDGGEALADNVTLRVRDYRRTLKQKWHGKNVLTVAHGDILSTVRYVNEELLPEQWEVIEKDESQRINNGDILWYSNTNPADAREQLPYLHWMRMIHPTDVAASPFGGEWREMNDNRLFSGTELLKSVELAPRLLS
ncbi:MAG: phosphoglycerate mutase family protein [Candidatus Saccharibacteria bacterium]|nr:phosphoglycerate mutase family protein [Candidatus Saccharibacteria bacterium]